MWIEPYNRNDLPAGVDNADFGAPLPEVKLLGPGRLGIDRTLELLKPVGIAPSATFPKSVSSPRPFLGCSVDISRGIAEAVPTTLFLPDSAAVVTDSFGAKLLHESTWHSEIWYSQYFRNDRSTNWLFRYRPDWPPATRVEGLVANCYHRYSYQYFHWFIDSLPRVWMVKQHFPNFAGSWFLGPLNSSFHRWALAMFGIDPDECLGFEGSPIVEFAQAINVAFQFVEPLKTLRPAFEYGTYNAGWAPDYAQDVRALAQTHYGLSGESAGALVYLDRTDSTHRQLTNSDKVSKILAKRGFKTITPGRLSFPEQVAALRDARLIVGVHGAGLTNLLWAPEGAAVIEMMPTGLNDVGYRFLAPMAGLRHAVVFAKPLAHPHGLAYAHITADIRGLNEALDVFLR